MKMNENIIISLKQRWQKKKILKQNNFGYMMNIDEKFVETTI